MPNAAKIKDIRLAEKQAKHREEQRINFLRAGMSHKEGRVFFYNLLERAHVFNDPFTADPLREAYSKGERNLGLGYYLDIVTHCPDQFVQMMKEAAEEDFTNAKRYDQPDTESDAESSPDSGESGQPESPGDEWERSSGADLYR